MSNFESGPSTPEPVPMSFSDHSRIEELRRDVEEIQSPLLMAMDKDAPPIVVRYQRWDIILSREFDSEEGYNDRQLRHRK
ncbi:MAG: hypothetical protein JWM81_801 [Candidatus Saccharibacteria bacterium]|nr:hypothetical protein [Candidatus Saccharibacteria bacterium]